MFIFLLFFIFVITITIICYKPMLQKYGMLQKNQTIIKLRNIVYK